MLQVVLLDLEPGRVGAHHPVRAGACEDEYLVVRVGAGGLEELAERTMVLHAELDRAAGGVRPGEQDAVVTPLQGEEVLEELLVVVELGRGQELL